jgi:hypothetical protein
MSALVEILRDDPPSKLDAMSMTPSTLIRANYLVVHAARIAEAAKKALRDDNGVMTIERTGAVLKELAMVLAFTRGTAESCGSSLEAVIAENIVKLQERSRRSNA